MFSYTDDAIVTSSPTGRHLSTVIRHPAGMPSDQWRKHADQVCKVLNELGRNAKLNYRVFYSLGAGHFQTVGRIDAGKIASDYQSRDWTQYVDPQSLGNSEGLAELRSSGPYMADLERRFGPTWPFEDQTPPATEARQPMPSADPQREENLALRRKLDDATTKLCAAQMLLEKPVRLTADDVLRVLNLQTDTAIEVDGRTLARVE